MNIKHSPETSIYFKPDNSEEYVLVLEADINLITGTQIKDGKLKAYNDFKAPQVGELIIQKWPKKIQIKITNELGNFITAEDSHE